jgi:predicted AAA+ superfamily ATPase
LKYFCEDKPQAYLMCAGSLLGVKLSDESFPVGKIEIHQLYPLCFSEFLTAIGEESLALAILDSSKDLPLAINQKIFELFKHYCFTGGLPEIVQTYINEKSQSSSLMPTSVLTSVRGKQNDLIETYVNDMAKHSGKLNSMHIRRVWEDIPRQLSQLHHKFQFKNVIPGKKSYADLSAPLDWLSSAGLVIQSFIVNEAQIPLKNFIQPNQFRLFCFDVGILGALSDFPAQSILELENESLIFKGHFLENFVAQTLHRYGFFLSTWMHNTSEIEFLIQNQSGHLFPIEVKSRRNSKAKSLSVFLNKYPHIKDFAIFDLNLETQGRHYPITSIERILRTPLF